MSSIQRVTIRDVAREANVSIATVSKALNGVDVVRPVTKEKIIQAAEKLNYVPNILGKQLKAHKTGMMGFYTTSISGPYFSVLVDAIAKESEKCGYSLNVLVSSNKKVVMNNILGGMVDGIISFEDILTVNFTSSIIEADVERYFFRKLVQDGIHVKIESNRGKVEE